MLPATQARPSHFGLSWRGTVAVTARSLPCGPINPMKISGPYVAATQYPRDRLHSRLMSESRFEDPFVRGYLKCSSVPDFRRRSFPLQLGGAKWTSPWHCTRSLYSLHLGREKNLRKIGQVNREKKPGSTRQNSEGAGGPHPLTHRASRLLVGSLPPLLCAARNLFGLRHGVQGSICKAHGITSCSQKELKCCTTP